METGSFVVLSLPYLAVPVGFDGTVFHDASPCAILPPRFYCRMQSFI